MAQRSNEIATDNLLVEWSNLMQPDEFRGSKKHDIQVVVDADFQAQLDAIGMPLTGTYENKEGKTIAKIKTTQFTKKNVDQYGDIFDSQGQRTDYFPRKGDVVRVKIWVREYEGKAGLWLSGIQVIEANSEAASSSGGFAPVEGGFTGSAPAAPAATTSEEVSPSEPTFSKDDLPF
jgi:hypothetical protein